MQRPFMQMPGVWHSSMSGEEIQHLQLAFHLRQLRHLGVETFMNSSAVIEKLHAGLGRARLLVTQTAVCLFLDTA